MPHDGHAHDKRVRRQRAAERGHEGLVHVVLFKIVIFDAIPPKSPAPLGNIFVELRFRHHAAAEGGGRGHGRLIERDFDAELLRIKGERREVEPRRTSCREAPRKCAQPRRVVGERLHHDVGRQRCHLARADCVLDRRRSNKRLDVSPRKLSVKLHARQRFVEPPHRHVALDEERRRHHVCVGERVDPHAAGNRTLIRNGK
mmetsp:Transcript_19083/g.67857  ORF Transcript_19083/g.67857 Transcript_19083/m.67857 type:complete len:201 (-) Transcript_19083:489-1091(-)